MSVAIAKKKVKEQPQDIDLDSILGSAAVSVEKKSTSKVPVLTVPKDVEKLAGEVRKAKDDLVSAESKFKTLEADFIIAVTPYRDNLCRQGYVSSVKVPDGRGGVSLSWSNSYSKIPLENAAAIQEVVGEQFADFFTRKMEISVKADISEESLKELIKSVGPERFAQLFDVKRWIIPTLRYTEQAPLLPQEKRDKLAGYVKQNKPSVKV